MFEMQWYSMGTVIDGDIMCCSFQLSILRWLYGMAATCLVVLIAMKASWQYRTWCPVYFAQFVQCHST